MQPHPLEKLSAFFETHPSYRTRGFLPAEDPLPAFSAESRLAYLDKIGARLPAMLEDPGFRDHMRQTFWPAHWMSYCTDPHDLPELRLYWLRVAFIASGYVHQIGQPGATMLPPNIALPLFEAARLLGRPPILSYDAYVLYNWRRLDPAAPIVPDNLASIQNFMELPDRDGVNQERWFMVIHVAIEAVGANILDALACYADSSANLDETLERLADTVREMRDILARIPEHMDPEVYYRTFRAYIQGFEGVRYECVPAAPMTLRGETGAQSSIVPTLTAFLKIPHEASAGTEMLADMRNYMPSRDRELLALVDAVPEIRSSASPRAWNGLLDAIAAFRRTHLRWAHHYIHKHVADPRGTGGTPYMQWLGQLAAETEAARM